MTDNSHLYQEIRALVKKMNNVLKTHAGKPAPKPRLKRDCAPATPLLERCAEAFNTSAKQVMANSRRQECVFARHLYCYIRRWHHGMHPEQIGAELGRHRTTVLNAINKATDLIKVDREFKKKYEEVLKSVVT